MLGKVEDDKPSLPIIQSMLKSQDTKHEHISPAYALYKNTNLFLHYS